MENGTVGLVAHAGSRVPNAESLVVTPGAAERTAVNNAAVSWIESASSNDYNGNNYNNRNVSDDDDDDEVLTIVLDEVRHAYTLSPTTSQHGTMRRIICGEIVQSSRSAYRGRAKM